MTSPKPMLLNDADLHQVAGGADIARTQGDQMPNVIGSAVHGTDRADYISMHSRGDSAFGGRGDDTMLGNAGDDILLGGDGADHITGGSGRDMLQGDAGNDFLDGGVGDGAVDTLMGGAGDDTFVWAPNDGDDMFAGGNGKDTLIVQNVTRADLLSGLALTWGGDLRVQVSSGPDGDVVTFVDSAGNPATFSGTLTIGNEMIRFSDLEQIRLA